MVVAPLKLYIAGDHGGFALKEKLISELRKQSIVCNDLGTHSEDSVDYPDFAHLVADKLAKEPTALAILICGTGIGISIAANRHPHIRAALVTTPFMAQMAKRHNNANVLCLGGRVVAPAEAVLLVTTWLNETYEGGRHDNRLAKINC